jgi:hypothetical protein
VERLPKQKIPKQVATARNNEKKEVKMEIRY